MSLNLEDIESENITPIVNFNSVPNFNFSENININRNQRNININDGNAVEKFGSNQQRNENMINEKLIQLYQATTKQYLLDELLLSERHFDTAFFGIFNMILKWIYVFRLRVSMDSSFNWSDALKPGADLYEKVSTRISRGLIIGTFLIFAMPYAYWVSLVDGASSNIYFNAFMTIIIITPMLTWLIHSAMVVKEKNRNTITRIKILRLSIARVENMQHHYDELQKNKECNEITIKMNEETHDNINKINKIKKMLKLNIEEAEHLERINQVNTDYSLNEEEQDMLDGMVSEMQSLEKLGEKGIAYRHKGNVACWNTYMILASVWTIFLWIIYTVWVGVFALDTECNSNSPTGTPGVCTIFIMLIFTSLVRFSIPIFILFTFVFNCRIVLQKINVFSQLHYGDVDTAVVCDLLRYNIKNRQHFASTWQWVFLAMFIIPLFCMILMAAAILLHKDIIHNEWFFLVYCVHYTLIGLIAVASASSISANSFDIRTDLVSNVARNKTKFINDREHVDAYFSYMEKCYNGFTVFGNKVDYKLLSQLSVILAGIISWLAENISKI
jgi:hypothetical protein